MPQGMNAGTMTATLKADTAGFITNMKAAGKEMSATASKAGGLKTAVGGIAAGIAAFVAYKGVQMMTQQFKESVSAAAQMQTALVGLTAITQAFGQDTNKATEAAQSLAADGLMSIADASSGLQNLIATNFTLEESINLMKGLKDSSAMARQGTLSIGEAVVGATQGLKNQNSIMVDNSGITKNLSTILTEAGKSQNDLNKVTSDASVRTALYNGILGEAKNFTNGAANSAQTYTGKQSALKTAMFNLHATIGKQLMPGMALLVDMFTKNANETTKNISASDWLGRAFYSVANVAKGLFLIFKGGLSILMAAGKTFWAVGQSIVGLINMINNLRNAAFGTFQAMGQALKGDFGGAWETMKNNAVTTVTDIGQSFMDVVGTMNSAGQAATGAVEPFMEAMGAFGEARSQSGYKELAVDVQAGKKEVSGLTGELGKGAKKLEELRDKIMDNSKAFTDLRDKFHKTMEDFKKKISEKKKEFTELKESVKDLRKEVTNITKDTNEQILKISETFAKNVAEAQLSFGGNVADEILKAEKSVSKFNETIQDLIDKRDALKADDITKQVGIINNALNDYATDAEKREGAARIAEIEKTAADGLAAKRKEVDDQIAEQTKQRDEQQQFLTTNAAAYTEFSASIAETRRRSGLDAIQLLRENFASQQLEMQNQKAIDLQSAETEKQSKIKELLDKFNEENKARVRNMDDIKKFLSQEEKANEKAVNAIKKKRDGLLKGIEKDFQKTVDYLNKISGGAVGKATGGTKTDISEKANGTGAKLQIGNINVTSGQDIATVLGKISLLARVV